MFTKKVHFKIKYSEVKKILKWKSYLNFKKTINYTSSWYKNYFDGKEMSEVTLLQIKEMISKIK